MMHKLTIGLLIALTIFYIKVIRMIFPSKEKLFDALSHFSVLGFLSALRGRVFEDNVMEAFIGMALVATVVFIGFTYVIVVILDQLIS
ncbi:MAG: hypothetical protein JXO44_14100 [Clostridia bacterium]|nr:hypothetical protein [Clostridia bacterium]